MNLLFVSTHKFDAQLISMEKRKNNTSNLLFFVTVLKEKVKEKEDYTFIFDGQTV
jgi:hypothetical protein